MRKFLSYIHLLAISLLPVIGKCQSSFSGEQKEVNESLLKIGKAWSENNLDTLEKYIDVNYSHTDLSGHLLDRKTWLGYVADSKKKNEQNPDIVLEDTHIQIYGEVGIVTGISVFTRSTQSPNDPNAAKTDKIRFTQVFKKENGVWKRIIFQGTIIE